MFRSKISWGLAVCLTLLVAEAGNAAPRTGGFPASAPWLDLETLWARAWSWLAEEGAASPSSGAVRKSKHGSMIDPDGGPKHVWDTDPGGAPLTTAGEWGKHGPVINPGRSN